MTPRLRSSVRLRHDRVRDRWMLLAPERGFVLSGSALAIVERIDGCATVDEIAAALGHGDDVAAFVRALVERRLVETC
jgi:pyrroloquinoline quinone biosynthesis protein D